MATDTRKRRRNFIISMIVVVTMLVSGLYYLASTDFSLRQNTEYSAKKPEYNGYSVNIVDAGNRRIIAKVESILPEYVAMPTTRCLSYQVIEWVQNISINGVGKPVLEAANPVESGENICGEMFIFFRFPVYSTSNETEKALRQQLENRLGSYFLKKVYSGTINTTGLEPLKLNIVGSTTVDAGDSVEVLVFMTQDNRVFALEKKRVYFGPTVPATVLSENALIAEAVVGGDFNLSRVEENITVLSKRIHPPVITINTSLDSETTEKIRNLSGVAVTNTTNTTEIEFNSSLAEIKSILELRNTTYDIVKGRAGFQIPLNFTVEAIKSTLADAGFSDIEVRKSASIELPDEVFFGEDAVAIQNNKNFSALIELKSKTGDRINVTLSAIRFADQYFIAGAQEAA